MPKGPKLSYDPTARTIKGTDADGRKVDTTYGAMFGHSRGTLMDEYRRLQIVVTVMANNSFAGSEPEDFQGKDLSGLRNPMPYPVAQVKAACQYLAALKSELGIQGSDPVPHFDRMFIF